MDYKEKATILRVCSSRKGERCSHCPAFGQGDRYCKRNAMKDGATAITDLLARAEAAEALAADRTAKADFYENMTHQYRDEILQKVWDQMGALEKKLEEAEARAEKAEICIEKIKTYLAFGKNEMAWEAIKEWRGHKEE